jgi:hypothetical protein
MNEPLSNQPAEAPSAPVAATSVWSRMMNVLAAPGEVFEEVRVSKPDNANWLVPILVSCVVSVIYVVVVFSQEGVQYQMREAREQQFQKQVETGKLTQQQADQAMAITEKFTGPAMMMVFGSISAVLASFAWLFFLALVIWLIGDKLFHGSFPYMQAAEVCALAGMVAVLGAIVTMLLVVATGSMFTTPGPALLIQEFDPKDKTHLALASVNVMTLWYTAVLALGLAKLSKASFLKSFFCLFIPYVLLRAGLILSGLGQHGM